MVTQLYKVTDIYSKLLVTQFSDLSPVKFHEIYCLCKMAFKNIDPYCPLVILLALNFNSNLIPQCSTYFWEVSRYLYTACILIDWKKKRPVLKDTRSPKINQLKPKLSNVVVYLDQSNQVNTKSHSLHLQTQLFRQFLLMRKRQTFKIKQTLWIVQFFRNSMPIIVTIWKTNVCQEIGQLLCIFVSFVKSQNLRYIAQA